MTKAELINNIAKDVGFSTKAVAKVLDSFTSSITNALKKNNDKVTLGVFGSFLKVPNKEKKPRNPRSGETTSIKTSYAVKFEAGKRLKEAVN